MTIKLVNNGTGPNTGDGDPLRTIFTDINDNFSDATNAASKLVQTSPTDTTTDRVLTTDTDLAATFSLGDSITKDVQTSPTDDTVDRVLLTGADSSVISGLGTAATEDIQTSPTDTASGRLLTTDTDIVEIGGLGTAALEDRSNLAVKISSVFDTAAFANLQEGDIAELVEYHPSSGVGGSSVLCKLGVHDGITFFSNSRVRPDWDDPTGKAAWFEYTGDVELGVARTDASELTSDHAGVKPYPSEERYSIEAIFAFTSRTSIAPKFLPYRYKFTAPAQVYTGMTVVGTKTPTANTDTGELEDGTIFVGTVDFKVNKFHGVNFGVDHGISEFPSADDNALKIQSTTASLGGGVFLDGVVGFNNKESAPFHAVLVEGFNHVTLNNIKGYYSLFNLAVKSKIVNMSNIQLFYAGSDNCIIKSDNQFGNTADVNINNISCIGTVGVTNYNLRISSFDAQIQRINVGNYNFKTASVANVYVDVNGSTGVAVNELSITSGNADGAGQYSYFLSGTIYSTLISGRAVNASSRILGTSGDVRQLDLANLFGSVKSASTNINSSINIGNTGCYTTMSNVTLTVDYSNTIKGGITFANTPEKNKLSNVHANIFGQNPYSDGFSSEAISGTTNTLTPIFGQNSMSSVIKVSHGAVAAAVDGLVREMVVGATRFPAGYRLTILNDDSTDLTVKNRPANYILNKVGVDVVIPASSTASYVFTGSVWNET